jgi:hypothetical protein
MCASNLDPHWIDPGTLARTRSDIPGTVGVAQNTLVVPPDLPHRLLLAAKSGLPYLAPEIRNQVAALLTLENFAFLAAFLAADAAFAGTGVGTVINIAAGGLLIVVVGSQVLESARGFLGFYRSASVASTPEQFREAGKQFAQAVSLLGIATVTALLSKRAGTKSVGKAVGTVGSAAAEASWVALADAIEFDIPANQGVIYAGLSPAEVVQAIAESKNPQGELINRTAERYGWTQESMDKDFGKEYTAATYRLWEYLSLKYQQALKGQVTAYVDSTRVRLDKQIFGDLTAPRGAGPEVEITNGKYTPSVILTELEELMSSNRNVTRVILKDVKTGKSWIYNAASKSTMTH